MLTNQTFIHLQRNWRNNLQFKQLLHIPPGASRFYIGHGLGAYSCAGLITAYRTKTRPAWKTYNCYNTGMKNLTYIEMSPDKRQQKRPWGRRFLSWYIIVFLLFFCVVLRQVPSHIYCCALVHRIFYCALLLFMITVRMDLLMIKGIFCNLCIAVCMLVVYLPILLDFS